ncbi:hypothetical protein DICVIV_10074 [Dictyocaulus viviparus]|uniref:Uncharacterized protein n=1 Tax=Dictyocaulus viviparus TaxID=29172 RepID=A0A0D8XH40_DICVI|nr:hypothetical protein DICVIV_10074 [Dictyocaulus viviparus]
MPGIKIMSDERGEHIKALEVQNKLKVEELAETPGKLVAIRKDSSPFYSSMTKRIFSPCEDRECCAICRDLKVMHYKQHFETHPDRQKEEDSLKAMEEMGREATRNLSWLCHNVRRVASSKSIEDFAIFKALYGEPISETPVTVAPSTTQWNDEASVDVIKRTHRSESESANEVEKVDAEDPSKAKALYTSLRAISWSGKSFAKACRSNPMP